MSIAQCAAAAGLSWWVARLAMLVAALAGTADALRSGERGIALTALRRARSSQPLIDELRATLTAGREVTAVERLTGSAGPPQPLPPARTLA